MSAQAEFASEVRCVLTQWKPNCQGGRYSGQQIARAKGIATKRLIARREAENIEGGDKK